jgi:hypothetical protein
VKKKLMLYLLFFLFAAPDLIIQSAYAGSAGDISIVAEDGSYKLYRDEASSPESRFSAADSIDSGVINPYLRALLEAYVSSGSGPYKTYYAPGEDLLIGASWETYFESRYAVIGKELKVTGTLEDTLTKTIVSQFSYTEIITKSDIHVAGVGRKFTLPLSAKNGSTYILTVEMTIPGITLTSSKAVKKLYLTTQAINDLPLPFLPDFRQGSWNWAKDQLGTCPNATIGNSGSATISKAFLFRYLGSDEFPSALDSCLTQLGGYLADPGGGRCHIPKDQTNPLIPEPTTHGHFKNEICAPPDVYWDGFFSSYLRSRIDNYLASGMPVIAKTTLLVNGQEHFVVIVGKRGTNWDIFDPRDGHFHMMETRQLGPLLGIWLFSQR